MSQKIQNWARIRLNRTFMKAAFHMLASTTASKQRPPSKAFTFINRTKSTRVSSRRSQNSAASTEQPPEATDRVRANLDTSALSWANQAPLPFHPLGANLGTLAAQRPRPQQSRASGASMEASWTSPLCLVLRLLVRHQINRLPTRQTRKPSRQSRKRASPSQESNQACSRSRPTSRDLPGWPTRKRRRMADSPILQGRVQGQAWGRLALEGLYYRKNIINQGLRIKERV